MLIISFFLYSTSLFSWNPWIFFVRVSLDMFLFVDVISIVMTSPLARSQSAAICRMLLDDYKFGFVSYNGNLMAWNFQIAKSMFCYILSFTIALRPKVRSIFDVSSISYSCAHVGENITMLLCLLICLSFFWKQNVFIVFFFDHFFELNALQTLCFWLCYLFVLKR